MLFDGTTCNAECVQHLLYSNLRRYSGELYLLRSPDMKWSLLFCWTRKYKFPRFWILIENYMQVLKRRWQIRTLLWTRSASSFYVYSSDFPRDKPTWISLTCAVSSRWRAFALSRCELSLLLFFFFFNFISCCSSEFRCYHCQKIDNMLWPPCEPNPYFWSPFCGTIAFHVYLLIQHR